MSVVSFHPGGEPAAILPLRSALADRTDRLRKSVSEQLRSAYIVHRQRVTPGWRARPSLDPSWVQAAARLVALSRQHSGLPLDPALYVYAQFERCRPYPMPADLTGRRAGRAYRRMVGAIVCQLQRELRWEQMRLARWLGAGRSLEAAIQSAELDLMPLHRFALASRAGLVEAARRWRAEALEQCHFCGLYVQVFRPLLSPSFLEAVSPRPR